MSKQTTQPIVNTMSNLGYASLIWRWLGDEPKLSLDDSSPRNLNGFCDMLLQRVRDGVKYYNCFHKTAGFSGIIGVQRHDKRSIFAGIFFAPIVRGTTFTQDSVKYVIEQERKAGQKSIHAAFYFHNTRIRAFLTKLGFREIQHFVAPAYQEGRAVPKIVMILDLQTEQLSNQ